MADIAETRSLCRDCASGQGCSLHGEGRLSVIECEEFDGGNHRHTTKRAATRPAARKSNPSGYMGLCADCLNSMTCMFPKPEGGIWHCEEFR